MDTTQFIITSLVFTMAGYLMAVTDKRKASFSETKRITQETIDTLINMGYLKTRGEGEDTELVKINEE